MFLLKLRISLLIIPFSPLTVEVYKSGVQVSQGILQGKFVYFIQSEIILAPFENG